jgi:hypothetical protein
MRKLTLTLFVLAVVLVTPVVGADENHDNPIAACKKMNCLGKDDAGNIVCTAKDNAVLATRVEKDKDHVYYQDKDGNLVDPETGKTLSKALADKEGKTYFTMGGKKATACPFCALGKCGEACKAPKGNVCTAKTCAKDGKAHVHPEK